MCTVKTPKVSAADTAPKDPAIIRNLYLDGIGPEMKAMRSGRSALRINRSGTPGAPVPPAAATPPPASTNTAGSPAPPSTPSEGLTGWSSASNPGSWGGVTSMRNEGRIARS